MEKNTFDIYECIKKFPNNDLKKMHREEKDGRMRTRMNLLGSNFISSTIKRITAFTSCRPLVIRPEDL